MKAHRSFDSDAETGSGMKPIKENFDREIRYGLPIQPFISGVILLALAALPPKVLADTGALIPPAAVAKIPPEPVEKPFGDQPFKLTASQVLDASSKIPRDPNDDSDILWREVRYAVDAEGREDMDIWTLQRFHSRTAMDREGAAFASYVSTFSDPPRLAARVIRKDGKVQELDPAQIVESSAEANDAQMYSDQKTLRAPFPGLEPGAIVESHKSHHQHTIRFPTGADDLVYLGHTGTVHNMRVEISLPAGTPFEYRLVGNLSIEPIKRKENDRIVWIFEFKQLKKPPPNLDMLPTDVPYVPVLFFSTSRSWSQVARWYQEVVDEKIAASDVKGLAEQAAKGATDRLTLINNLLSFVQHEVRYVALELGHGAIIPRAPEESLKKKYGDCKDMSTMLVALLRAKGIEAHVAILNASTSLDVPKDLPVPGYFNHAIVYVPGKTDLWIDPTDPYSPAGILMPPVQGRWALVAAAGTSKVIRTPTLLATQDWFGMTFEEHLSEVGGSEVVVYLDAMGPIAGIYRRALEGNREGFTESLVARFKEGDVHGDREVTVGEPVNFQRTDLPIAIPVTVRDVSAPPVRFPRGETDMLSLAMLLPSHNSLSARSIARNKAGLGEIEYRWDVPIRTQMVQRVYFPPGYVPLNVCSELIQTMGPARLKRTCVVEPGMLTVHHELDLIKRQYSSSEYVAFTSGIKQFSQNNLPTLEFVAEGVRLIDEGKDVAGLELYQKAVREKPEDPVNLRRLAGAYQMMRLNDHARTEGRRAVELDAQSAENWLTLGQILLSDSMDRPFVKGFDPEGAEDALERAVALSPRDAFGHGLLAEIYSRDKSGRMYGEGARFADAIREYQTALEITENEFADGHYNLVILLILTNRLKEAQQHLEAHTSFANFAESKVMVEALENDLAAGIRVAAELAPDPERKKGLYLAVAQTLTSLRYYALAADFFVEATKDKKDDTWRELTPDAIRKATPAESARLDDKKPETVVKRLILAALNDDPDFEAVQVYLHSSAAMTDKEALYAAQLTATLRHFSDGNSAQFGRDMVAGTLEFRVEGRDSVGYRIELQGPLLTPSAPKAAFVVREKRDYKVVGLGTLVAGLGIQALTALEAGRKSDAQQWLNWANQALEGSKSPFLRVWSPDPQNTEADLKLAIGVLLADHEITAKEAIPLLTAAKAPGASANADVIDDALQSAFFLAGRYEEALAIVQPRGIDGANWKDVADTWFHALRRLQRNEEALEFANRVLETHPGDSMAINFQAQALSALHDFTKNIELMKRRMDQGYINDEERNNLAWTMLFAQVPLEEALDVLEKSKSWLSPGALHTRATLYAELGRTRDAMNDIAKLRDMTWEKMNAEWYVIGRVKEQHGFKDEAIAAYRQVERPESPDPTNTWHLAQQRLEALTAAGVAK